jgi:adhesin HecA-like repeat protein
MLFKATKNFGFKGEMKKMKNLKKAMMLVFALIFALSVGGTAWADAYDAYEVADIINNWSHGGNEVSTFSATAESATSVTVEGEVTGATDRLEISYLDGVTIHWKAKVRRNPVYPVDPNPPSAPVDPVVPVDPNPVPVDPTPPSAPGGPVDPVVPVDPNPDAGGSSSVGGLISLGGKGALIVEEGGIIQGIHDSLLIDEEDISYNPSRSSTTINITVKKGGRVSSSGRSIGGYLIDAGGAIKNLSTHGGNITIEAGGIVDSPNIAICLGTKGGILTIQDTENKEKNISGLVELEPEYTFNGTLINRYTAYAYGDFVLPGEFFAETNMDDITDSADIKIPSDSSLRFEGNITIPKPIIISVEDGGKLVFDENAVCLLKGDLINYAGGDLEIEGTLTLDPDPGVLDNYGTVTVSSTGKIINQNVIYNRSAGIINNQGVIDNNDGVIENRGTLSGNAPDGGTVNNHTSGDGGGSGGCSTGSVGIATLILAGFLLKKKRA